MHGRANPHPAFEACDSSLKRILEGEEDQEPPMLGAHKLPSPSGVKLRRVGQAAFGAPGLNAQAAELQAARLNSYCFHLLPLQVLRSPPPDLGAVYTR